MFPVKDSRRESKDSVDKSFECGTTTKFALHRRLSNILLLFMIEIRRCFGGCGRSSRLLCYVLLHCN